MQSISSLQYTAELSCGVSGFDTLLLLLTIKSQHLKGKLEKALAYEDSMAQSAKQTGLEVMGSSHVSTSKRLFESRQQRRDWKAASEAAAETLRLQLRQLTTQRLWVWVPFTASNCGQETARCAVLIPTPSPATIRERDVCTGKPKANNKL